MTESLDVEQLWHLAWPEVPWLFATPEDRKLYLDHANSLYWYNKGR